MTVTPLPLGTWSGALAGTPQNPDAPLELGAPLDLDAPLAPRVPASHGSSFADTLAGALDDTSTALAKADGAERAFANGRGGMQEMVLERAQADIALSVASAAASRTAQALGTILNMQV